MSNSINKQKETIEKCRFQKENKKKLFENDFAFIIISLRFIIGVPDSKIYYNENCWGHYYYLI